MPTPKGPRTGPSRGCVCDVTNGQDRFLLSCVYCPPDHRAKAYEYHQDSLDLIHTQKTSYANFDLMGDFNSHIDWSNPIAPKPLEPMANLLLDITETTGLVQLCGSPTYTLPKGSSSHLDLAFVSNPSLVVDCTVQDSLSGCDHKAIYVRTYISLPRLGRHVRLIHSYARTNVAHLKNLLHIAPWCMVLNEDTVDDMYRLYLCFMSAIEKECVPHFRAHGKRRLPWISPEIISLIRLKHRLFRKAKKAGCRTCEKAKDIQREIKKEDKPGRPKICCRHCSSHSKGTKILLGLY